MAGKLCLGKEVLWAATKKGISMNDFTTEAQIWMNIICRLISTCTHMTAVIDMHACMVFLILDNIFFNVGHLVISDMKFYRNHGGIHLLFPSFITKLFRREGVGENSDNI